MDNMAFASTLIWYDTHRQTYTGHTRTNILAHTHINTYWHDLLRTHSSYLYYTEWITFWYKDLLYRGTQDPQWRSYICCLDSIRISPSRETQKKKTVRNDINRLNTCTTQKEKDNFRKAYLVLVSNSLLFQNNPLFYQPFPFYGKILTSLLWGKFRKLKPLSFINEGFQLWSPVLPRKFPRANVKIM